MRMQALKALFLGGLIALTAAGQERKTDTKPAPEKKGATLEDDIARAVQSHPDVRVAEAEAQLANAKLQQTKQAVAQKVAAVKRDKDRAANELLLSKSRLEVVRRSMDLVQKHLERMMQLQKAGNVAATELAMAERELDKARLPVLAAEQEVEASKAKLANAEAEYDALVGKAAADKDTAKLQRILEYQLANERLLVRNFRDSRKDLAAPTGSVPDRIRTAMAKRVAIEVRNVPLNAVVEGLQKAAGLDVIVRFPKDMAAKFTFAKQELPLSAWFELICDELADDVDPKSGGKVEWYIRDYGLTLSEYGRPEGAMSLSEFLKTGTPETEKPKVEPKK